MSEQNPYASAAAPAAAPQGNYSAPQGNSPYASQPGDQRFAPAQPMDPRDVITRNDNHDWENSAIANQQDQLADTSGAAQIGDVVRLDDGSTHHFTQESADLMQQFHQSVEGHFGAGAVQGMLDFARQNIDASTQASLERLVLSGDPASMQRAVNFVAQKMQGQQRNVHQNAQNQFSGAQQAQQHYPTGLSQQAFYEALSALERQGYQPGQQQYDSQYQQLVQQRALGKRQGY